MYSRVESPIVRIGNSGLLCSPVALQCVTWRTKILFRSSDAQVAKVGILLVSSFELTSGQRAFEMAVSPLVTQWLAKSPVQMFM